MRYLSTLGAPALVLLVLVAAEARPSAEAEEPRWMPASIGFLVLDGVYNTELVAPLDVMQHVVGRVASSPRVFTVGLTKEPVRSFEGLRIVPDYTIDDAPFIDVLVVPSTAESRGKDRKNEALVRWIRKAGGEARHVVSLCWGAFLLAEAGLLDGGPATTFPADQDRLEAEYPKIELRRDVSFVDAGKALTSVGGVKSYELAMYFIENVYGEDVAAGIASGLVMDWDRRALRFHRAP